MIKINLGGGPKKVEGYINMDGLWWDGATDIIQDLTKPPYKAGSKLNKEQPDEPLADNSVDEILCHEVLEHIGFREINAVIDEVYRILKPGGKFNIQVPDIDKMCKMYAAGLICDCVPHKAVDGEFEANPDCFSCKGEAQINPTRWLYAFIGAQKHQFDIHRNIFTPHKLRDMLIGVGFSIEQKHDIYKIKITATK